MKQRSAGRLNLILFLAAMLLLVAVHRIGALMGYFPND